MTNHNVDFGMLARILQTMCMLVLLLIVAMIFVHSVAPGDVQSRMAMAEIERLSAAGLLAMPLP